jgi:Tol biopolymer transport system component
MAADLGQRSGMTPEGSGRGCDGGGVFRTAMSCCSLISVAETIGAMKRLSVIVVVAIATAVAAGLGRASAPSRIVFTADRAPSLTGEIYRLDPNGHRVNLSNSPFQDSAPVVSPDGKRVAFFSYRSGALSVWEVGIDGGGVVQVGPPTIGSLNSLGPYGHTEQCGCLAWQPHGGRLALLADQAVFILRPGHRPLQVLASSAHRERLVPAWSPDGKVLVVWDGPAFSPSGTPGVARAFSPSGRPLWSVAGAIGPSFLPWSWSRRGLLALPINPPFSSNVALDNLGVRVYDERGHRRFVVNTANGSLGTTDWSPDGSLVAVDFGRRLEVLTSAGRRVLRRRVGSCSDLVWASDRRVLVGGESPCRVAGVDIRSGRVSRASSRWFGTRSADSKLAAFAAQKGLQIAIGVAPIAGGPRRTYRHVPACRPRLGHTPVGSLQFAGRSRALVYTSYCPSPYTNLYSVAPDGSGLQQITTGGSFAQLALSPDGTRIAYSYRSAIWIRNSTGAQVALTTPNNFCAASKGIAPDVSPSWSPDGTTILFERAGCPAEPDSLYTVPASGGASHDLGIAGQSPTWGPSKIAYITQADITKPGGAIWTANPDGTNPVQIATDGSNPAWSADGRLAYLTGTNNTTVVVGSTQTALPFTKVNSLAWSPDGTRFAVTARTTPTGPDDVYTINTDGSNPTQLTHNYEALAVSWR